ncbi:MAG: hypothetical protein IJU98_05095 [Synergistaceae bacterium]|nr:hypothetical protein [Synergistaceae bacterium]
MYFLWKRTQHGTIRISRDGLFDFVQGFLNKQSRLHSLAVARPPVEEGEDRWLTVILSSRDPAREPRIERRLSSLVRPLGLLSSVVWISRSGSAEWRELCRSVLGSPWTWMSLGSSAALVALAGWSAFFWTAFWGTAAWFLVKGLSLLSRSSLFRAPGGR